MSDDSEPSISWVQRMSQLLLAEPKDRAELVRVLRSAQQRNLLNSHALAMVEGVLQVSAMQVRDIMIPRAQMIMVKRDDPPEVTFPLLVESAHSRFPVYAEDRTEVVGTMLAKDLLKYCFSDEMGTFQIRDVMRPAIFVPESKRLDVLLKAFQSNRNHMAIVVDEYGAASGLVTIEDVLEQIVGEIEDEHDIEEDAYILQHSETQYTVKALTPIEDFNEQFDRPIKLQGKEFDTIGGIVTNAFGHMPERGEKISLNPYHFEVLRADNRRVYLLKMVLLDEAVSAKPSPE